MSDIVKIIALGGGTGGGGESAIEDVTVNGESVVTDRVAEIDLTNYALKVDLQELQTKAITDSAGYYTTDTVEGALAEIGAKLAEYPSEVWQGGSY